MLVVVLYHSDLGIAPGGFLGVSLFFTLSGFLITSGLLHEYDVAGRVSLPRFYERRARRLLPASLLCLALVVALTHWWSPPQQANLAGDVISSALNIANWRFALSEISYSDLLGGQPSPLRHFWSLAIEEQLYLGLPLLITLGLRRSHRTLAIWIAVLVATSLLATLLTTDRDLVYNGTHTRAGEVLLGVLVAVGLRRRLRLAVVEKRPPLRKSIDVAAGAMAWIGFAALVGWTSIDQAWIYRGGLLGVAGLSAVLIVLAADERFPACLLAATPLVWLGRVSYGVYLFHWPVFVMLDASRVGISGVGLFALRCSVTAVFAAGSYKILEQPIRHQIRLTGGKPVALAACVGTVVIVVASLVFVSPPTPSASDVVLARGAQEVVVFTPTRAAPNEINEASAAEISTTSTQPLTSGATDVSVVNAGMEEATTVLIVGSRTDIVDKLAAESGVVVVDATDNGCPVNDPTECAPLATRAASSIAEHRPDVVVVSTGAVENEVSQAQNALATDHKSLQRLGALVDAMFDDLAATVEVAKGAEAQLLFYTAGGRGSLLYPRLAQVALEHPEVGPVASSTEELLNQLRSSYQEVHNAQSAPLRVVVVGDSTSLIFAQGLSDGGDGSLEVTWTGANGCPLVSIVALRPGPGSNWNEVECPDRPSMMEKLLPEIKPDVVVLMTGSTEQSEHQFEPTGRGHNSTSDEFLRQRTETLDRLLDVTGPKLPVLVADFPQVSVGTYAAPELLQPARLNALNDQVDDWAARYQRVERLEFRSVIDQRETDRGSIRPDGVHVDTVAMEELARDVLVPQMIRQVTGIQAQLETPG